jgi:AraC-like DNA-binding protein
MSDLATLDLLLRAAAVALAVAVASAIAFHPQRNRAAIWAALVVGGMGAFMIASVPDVHETLGPAAYFFNAWCLATPAAAWMLARALFREEPPRIEPLALVGFMTWVTIAMIGDYGRFGSGPMSVFPEGGLWLLVFARVVGLGFLFGACALAIAHWRADLVEHRRRARAGFVVVFGAMFVSLATSDLIFGRHGAPLWLLVVAHMMFVVFALALLIYFVRGGLAELFSDPAAAAAPASLALVRNDAVETALAAQLVEAMDKRKLWKREGLSIAALAADLGTQEYRLRRVINRRLGYRNFNEFLHDYRLKEIAARLADPAERHLPVLTLALDGGYGSIGPFNAAFKARFGVTPTQFRNQQALVRKSASRDAAS